MSLAKNENTKKAYLVMDEAISFRDIGKTLGISNKTAHAHQINALAKIKLIIDKNPELKECLRSYL